VSVSRGRRGVPHRRASACVSRTRLGTWLAQKRFGTARASAGWPDNHVDAGTERSPPSSGGDSWPGEDVGSRRGGEKSVNDLKLGGYRRSRLLLTPHRAIRCLAPVAGGRTERRFPSSGRHTNMVASSSSGVAAASSARYGVLARVDACVHGASGASTTYGWRGGPTTARLLIGVAERARPRSSHLHPDAIGPRKRAASAAREDRFRWGESTQRSGARICQGPLGWVQSFTTSFLEQQIGRRCGAARRA